MQDKIRVLCGVEQVKKMPIEPYADIVCEFLADYADALRRDERARRYPDIQTFAFWIRKANIIKQKKEYQKLHEKQIRMGKGIIFHIAPSNVPVNFIYSYAFGLLAGNANIVRVPSREFPQIDCMCEILQQLFSSPKYEQIRETTSILQYERNREITDIYSGQCDMRVIWGGDTTIDDIRKSPIPPRSTDITFADRYSFGIIGVKQLSEATEKEVHQLAEKFYNDTYLIDQNACSTPHLIGWKRDGMSDEAVREQQNRFWQQVYHVAEKYDLTDSKVSEKYKMLCEKILAYEPENPVKRYNNLLYVCDLDTIPEKAEEVLRGRYGLFYQCIFDDWGALSVLSGEKVQTAACYGIDVEELLAFMKENYFMGIDRIVPFGRALDIDIVWDGIDLIGAMSRIVQVSR